MAEVMSLRTDEVEVRKSQSLWHR